LHISGLDSYIMPHPVTQPQVGTEPVANGSPTGSGPSGDYLAQDIRKAYMSGVSASGGGQSVGLLEYNGYYNDLIEDYQVYNGLSTVTPTIENFAFDGYNGDPTGTGYYEVQLDIEMAIAMAPGLDSLIVYEMPPPTGDNIPSPPDDALNYMAAQDLCNQLSSSWEYNLSANTDQIFQELAAQGQSFFQSSGDGGGRTGTNVYSPFDDPYVTLVGATELTTSGAGGAYSSEVVLNDPLADDSDYEIYSGGGISPNYTIPWWQQSVSMSSNGGSTGMRNMPDVAILGYDVYVFYSETAPKAGGYEGTSVSAPLWAGFMACVNEQAANDGLPAIGFANPALYAIGQSSSYSSCFHDITSGNNENPLSPTEFTAVTGYDLCTGWGTPKGSALINALCVNPVPGNIKWVQFGAASGGNGSWAAPYNTMAAAVAGVPSGGTIIIKGGGTSSETPTISKPMNILSFGTNSTIGN
jgi:subtilase family serine protease